MTLKFGTIGDSRFDAYDGTDNRGGAYAAVTYGPIDLLVLLRGWDLGAWGEYGEPRRLDWAHNCARSSATSLSLGSQTSVLVPLIQSGAVEYVGVNAGANDFAPYGAITGDIASGALSGGALTTTLQARANGILTAVNACLTAGALGLVTGNFPYWGDEQYAAAGYDSPAELQRIRDAVHQANTYLNAGLQAAGVAWEDRETLADNAYWETHGGAQGQWFGSQFLEMDSDDEPHNILLGDAIHQGTVHSGLVECNRFIIGPLNRRYNLGIRPLTASEVWLAAGVLAGGVFGSLRRS